MIIGIPTAHFNTQLKHTLSEFFKQHRTEHNHKDHMNDGTSDSVIPSIIGLTHVSTDSCTDIKTIGELTVEEPELSVEVTEPSVAEPGPSVEEPEPTGDEPEQSVDEPNPTVEELEPSVEEPELSVEEPTTREPPGPVSTRANSLPDHSYLQATESQLVKILDYMATLVESQRETNRKVESILTGTSSNEENNDTRKKLDSMDKELRKDLEGMNKKLEMVLKRVETKSKEQSEANQKMESVLKNVGQTEGNNDIRKKMESMGIDIRKDMECIDKKLEVVMKEMKRRPDERNTPTCTNTYHLVQGPKDPLSNFHRTRVEHKIGHRPAVFPTAEHCFQYRKAHFLIGGKHTGLLRDIMQAKTAHEAKWLGDKLNSHDNIREWQNIACDVMKSILQDKHRASAKFREKLQEYAKSNTLLYHSVRDPFWGIGIDTEEVVHPLNPSHLRGKNMHGKLLMELANQHTTGSHCSVPTHTPNMDDSTSSMSRQKKLPKIIVVGNSLTTPINERALGQHTMEVSKIPATNISAVRDKLIGYDGEEPQCIVIQAITNEARDTDKSPKLVTRQCLDDFEGCLDTINNKWPLCKPIVCLAPPRGDDDRCAGIQAAINSQLRLVLDERGVDCMNLDDFGYNAYPNQRYYSDFIHFNQVGVSRYASRMQHLIHKVIKL